MVGSTIVVADGSIVATDGRPSPAIVVPIASVKPVALMNAENINAPMMTR